MNFFELAYFRLNENFLLGLFNGILFSIPISVPLLICFRYASGVYFSSIFSLPSSNIVIRKKTVYDFLSAFFGTVFGQLSFFGFLCFGARPLIQFWYTCEPFLTFLGLCISFHIATKFFKSSLLPDNFGEIEYSEKESIGLGSGLGNKVTIQNLKNIFLGNTVFSRSGNIFISQILLMFLNPIFPAIIPRLFLNQEILSHFGFTYSIGFLLGSLSLFIFGLLSISIIYTTFNWSVSTFGQTAKYIPFLSRYNFAERKVVALQPISQKNVNNFFVFSIVGCLIYSGIQYSWRFFIQYPLEFFISPILTGSSSITSYPNRETKQSIENPTNLVNIKREFPSFDTSIRNREKNLPMDRFLPIERINNRRTLNGRPPLSEEQKSNATLKYNSFFLNKISAFVEELKRKNRENLCQKNPTHFERLVSYFSSGAGSFSFAQSETINQPQTIVAFLNKTLSNASSSSSLSAYENTPVETSTEFAFSQPIGRSIVRQSSQSVEQPGSYEVVATQTTEPEKFLSIIRSFSDISKSENNLLNQKRIHDTTKGKSQYSYIQNLLNSQPELRKEVNSTNPFLHEDLELYCTIYNDL